MEVKEDEIKCPRQKNEPISIAWCDQARHRDFCGSCKHSENREVSKYQKSKGEKQ
jgi:hypothetical protein